MCADNTSTHASTKTSEYGLLPKKWDEPDIQQACMTERIALAFISIMHGPFHYCYSPEHTPTHLYPPLVLGTQDSESAHGLLAHGSTAAIARCMRAAVISCKGMAKGYDYTYCNNRVGVQYELHAHLHSRPAGPTLNSPCYTRNPRCRPCLWSTSR